MNHQAINERLRAIFQNVFFDDALEISRDTTAKDIPGWDSINFVILLNEVRRVFSVEFEIEEILELKNVGDLIELISTKATGN